MGSVNLSRTFHRGAVCKVIKLGWDRMEKAMKSIFCTHYPHTDSKGKLCHFPLSHIPGGKALTLKHGSEAVGFLACPGHVNTLRASLTQASSAPYKSAQFPRVSSVVCP